MRVGKEQKEEWTKMMLGLEQRRGKRRLITGSLFPRAPSAADGLHGHRK